MSDLLIDIQDAIIAGDFIKAVELLEHFEGAEGARQALAVLTDLANDQEEMGF